MRKTAITFILIVLVLLAAGFYIALGSNHSSDTLQQALKGIKSAQDGRPGLYAFLQSHPELKVDSKGAPRVFTVTLITGDKLLVDKSKEGYRYAFITHHYTPGYSILKSHDGDLYFFPNNVDISRFSPELFSLKTLYHYQVEIGLRNIPIIIKFKPQIRSTEETLIESDLPIVKEAPHLALPIINGIAIRVPLEKTGTFFEEARTSRNINFVTLDHIRYVASGGYSPTLKDSVPWIGGTYAWSHHYNGSGVKIAILDTGIDPTHPDFYVNNHTKIIGMKSFVDFDFNNIPDESVQDLHGHGTHVAGIAAGTGAYLDNITGVAPGAELLVGKVLSNEGYGYDSWIISGIEWAVNNSADIISMSLGGTAYPIYDPLADAVNKAVDEGVLVVVAAGNEGDQGFFTIDSPGIADKALTVGAVYTYDSLVWFSSRGPTANGTLKPDVVAPGYDIISARASHTLMGLPATLKHVAASGTSMATPHVSGAAAIFLQVLENNFDLNTIQGLLGANKAEILKDAIVSTSLDYWGEPLLYGAGLINITNFLSLVEKKSFLIVHPARTELGLDKPNATITIYNPWDDNVTLLLFGQAFYGNVTGNTPSPPPSDAFTYPSSITVPAHSTYSFNVSVNTTKLARLDTYALELFFINATSGDIIEKALIGIDTFRPLNANPHSYVTLNVTYNGIPVEFEALAGYYTDAETGYPWVHEVYASGTGTGVIGPLYEDSVYYFIINSNLNATQLGMNTDAAFASIHYAIAVPPTPTNMTIDIDLSSYPQSVTIIPNNLYATGGEYYISLLLYNGQLTDYWETIFQLEGIGETNTTLIEGVSAAGDPTILSNVMLIPYNAGIDFEAQNIESLLVSNGEPQFNSHEPIKRFVRAFNYELLPNTIIVNPSEINYTIINTRAVITKEPVQVQSYLAHWTSNLQYSFPSFVGGKTGTIVVYMIDTNDDYYSSAGYAKATITSGDNRLDIEGTDALGMMENSTTYVFDPLLMPKGATLWTALYGYPSLDEYNFTGAYNQAHMFRETFFGSFTLQPHTVFPVYSMETKLNTNYTSIVEGNNPILGDTIWNYTRAVYLTHPSEEVSLKANLTAFENQLSFLSKAAMLRVNVTTVTNYTDISFLQYSYIGYSYGIGVRDIVPLAGFNELLNMIPLDTNAVFAVLFNMPTQGNISLTSTHIYLTGPGNILIPVPIISWDFNTLSDAIAYIIIDTSGMTPGSYGMLVEGMYNDTYGDTVNFALEVDPAFYIGISPGIPQIPVLSESFKGARGEALENITAGETIASEIRFAPGAFAYMPSLMSMLTPQNANLTIRLVTPSGEIEEIKMPLYNQTRFPMKTELLLPWGTTTFNLEVTLTVKGAGVLYNESFPGR